VRATAVIDEALFAFFENLDGERWGTLAGRLHPDVELADELTGDWLRGRERVAAYLRAQAGIVTDVKSDLRSGQSRWITQDLGLVTFLDRARYRLEAIEHREDLTGSALFSFEAGDWTLLLFHLGAQATVRESRPLGDRPAGPDTGAPATPGEALRNGRKLAGLSLRALGSQVGLSASFLSQVERGAAEPSVNTLLRLAEALDIPVGELLGTGTTSPRVGERVVRREERRRVAVPGAGAELQLLTDDAAQGLEAAIVTVPPGAGPGAAQTAEPGERLLHVVEGELRVSIGAEEIVLGPGDSFTVPAGKRYALANGAPHELRYVTALARPERHHPLSTTERSIQ
jgi:transcriptional regulator with XRE-family HTH domain